MIRYLKLLPALLFFSLAGVNADTMVEQPSRAFGYFIGDILEQRIRIELDGKRPELAGFPAIERVGPWLQRLSSELVDDRHGQQWLELRYQVINASEELRMISLPALKLQTSGGAVMTVEPWPVSISPLTAAMLSTGVASVLMRPDQQPVVTDGYPAVRRFQQTVLALVVTLLLWLGWLIWRRNADIKRLPFAQAWHNLRKLDSNQPNEDSQAWLEMHRAFNDCAGKSINSATIDELIRQQGWLEAFESRIAEFYQASAARFFEHGTQPEPFRLTELGKALYLAEKRDSDGYHSVRR